MKQKSAPYRDDVEQLRQRFAEWRKAHTLRSKFPEQLWAAAAQLAQRDGIPATVQALKVDKPSLQKWTDRLGPRRSPKQKNNAAPTFVELLASSPASALFNAAASCLVEVESPRGGKLRLELKGVPTNELAELLRVFAAA